MKLRIIALPLFLFSTSAFAMPESTRNPLYVQGTFGFAAFEGGSSWFRADVELATHPSGRHDGFVIGVRQILFTTQPEVLGATVARLGWDIAIPIKDGKFEVTIAPFGIVGGAYGNGYGFFDFGFGAEGRFFFYDNAYAFARPFEMGGFIRDGGSRWVYDAGVGAGWAF